MDTTTTTNAPCTCQDHSPADRLIRDISIYYTLAAILVVVVLFGLLVRGLKSAA